MAWVDDLPPPHTVFIECRCPDVENCATNNLAFDRAQGWKSYFLLREQTMRMRGIPDVAHALALLEQDFTGTSRTGWRAEAIAALRRASLRLDADHA